MITYDEAERLIAEAKRICEIARARGVSTIKIVPERPKEVETDD